MKTLTTLSLLAVLGFALPGAALATEFVTVTFGSSDGSGVAPNLGESFSILDDTYTASFSNFVLTSQPFIDVQWTFRFDTDVATPNSPATQPYGVVTQTVRGTASRAAGTGSGPVSFSAVLSESITDAMGLAVGSGSRQFNFSANVPPGSESVPFEVTLEVPFDRPLSKGFAIKDDFVFNPGTGTVVRVNSVSQGFKPVPEPASMAVLGLGALALLRRRRSR